MKSLFNRFLMVMVFGFSAANASDQDNAQISQPIPALPKLPDSTPTAIVTWTDASGTHSFTCPTPEHACPSIPLPPNLPPPTNTPIDDTPQAPSGAPLLATIKQFLSQENLLDYTAFSHALEADGIVRGKIRSGIHGESSPPVPVEYSITTEGFELPHQAYLSPYHEEMIDIEIGAFQDLQKIYCITRDDAAQAFGSDDAKDQAKRNHYYDHKFDYEASKGYAIYVTLFFGGWQQNGPVQYKCARNISLTQYQLRKPQ